MSRMAVVIRLYTTEGVACGFTLSIGEVIDGFEYVFPPSSIRIWRAFVMIRVLGKSFFSCFTVFKGADLFLQKDNIPRVSDG